MKVLHLVAAVAFAAALPATAVAQIDCDAFANFAGVEPAGYAEQCLGPSTPAVPPTAPLATTDTAYAHDIGFISDNFVSHDVGDLSAQTVTGASTDPIFGYDFSADGSTLYALSNTNDFGTSDLAGGFAVIGTAKPAGEHAWTGLAVDGATGTIYASSAACGKESNLYTIDPMTGSATPIGSDTTSTCTIAIAMNCDGAMYAHDIISDSIYRVDTGTGTHTLVGATGLAANFAQGMDFDNEDGTLYIYGYTGGGTNTYGTVDLVSGAVTPINLDSPLGEWEGATQTVCFQNPLEVPTTNVLGLVALALLLAVGATFAMRRRTA